MNVPLLREIQQQILAEPNAFRMDKWNCGTAQCVAGWACSLSGKTWVPSTIYLRDFTNDKVLTLAGHETDPAWQWPVISRTAAEALDITHDEAQRLFLVGGWPDAFDTRYEEAGDEDDRKAMAQIAVERIDHFIATNGAE